MWQRFILRTGTLLSLLIAAVFVVSAWWQVAFQVPTSRGPAMYVVAGSVMLTTDELMSVAVNADRHSYGLLRWNSWAARRINLRQGPTSRSSFLVLEFPIYAPLAVTLLATLAAWRFWPKPVKPGHCGCGYDLQGNESGVCPECGRACGK